MDPKWHPKVMKNDEISSLERQGGDCDTLLGRFWPESKSHVFLSSLVAQKIWNIGPKSDLEAPTWPRDFPDKPSPGGLGPWGGLARDMKLDTRRKKHETRIMKHETSFCWLDGL